MRVQRRCASGAPGAPAARLDLTPPPALDALTTTLRRLDELALRLGEAPITLPQPRQSALREQLLDAMRNRPSADARPTSRAGEPPDARVGEGSASD